MATKTEMLKQADARACKYAMAGLSVRRKDDVVFVEQLHYTNHIILTHNELRSRAEKIYGELGITKYKTTMHAPDISMVTPAWVKQNMKRFRLTQKEVASHVGLNQSYLSTALQGEELTLPLKHLLYFYFAFLIAGEEQRAKGGRATEDMIRLIKKVNELQEKVKALEAQ